jgi:hypothetical protein
MKKGSGVRRAYRNAPDSDWTWDNTGSVGSVGGLLPTRFRSAGRTVAASAWSRWLAGGLVLSVFLVLMAVVGDSRDSVPAGAQESGQCAVPLDIALVFDHSSSMNQDGGAKLAAAKAAALSFIGDVRRWR